MNTKNTKGRVAAVGAALVTAAALPLGLAAPAQATPTWHDGCLLTTDPPEFRSTWNSAGVKEIFYPFHLVCLPTGGSSISVEVETYTREQDLVGRAGDVDADGVNNADEDVIGKATKTLNYGWLGGSSDRDVKGLLSRTDNDGNDEDYAKVRFRVTIGFVTGSWSAYELSTPTRVWWA